MEFIRLDIPDVVEIRPRRFADDRGWFAETFKRSAFEAEGLDPDFVQDNRSLSRAAGTVRGLHFQLPPFAQAKLVSVARGAILDVAVDIRRSSQTFGRHVAARLDAENGALLYVPEGFAHGFCTLEPDTEVIYRVSRPYSAAHERAVFWADPALAIDWPVEVANAVVSEKDAEAPKLAATPELF
ncbi:dTDP-4-dehydrorhamnose 3,5-epimerase [Chelatococcus sambhunathii]|uniref:dTDP-4-dehydrorhamnose 3,5-epimerase n=1 Tax=Chelatococcus sambhunathii TaxID=363953 RepID=A0ABU1DBI0_9HYPH|nr:dTDP-4-dehydrorhamnose 3,5-epimerase [Chelatococcus sambhunathii]MDR4305425.1 dTDP-4-dehydrorhamnose 3,5-epimerase [Chelatococcus sambhunathii]